MLTKLVTWVKSFFTRSEFVVQGSPRSPKWDTFRTKFVANKRCAVCDCNKNLQAHHKKPFNEHPELELDENNLVVLCQQCHFAIGHLFNYRLYNHDIDNSVKYFRLLIKRAKAHLKRNSTV